MRRSRYWLARAAVALLITAGLGASALADDDFHFGWYRSPYHFSSHRDSGFWIAQPSRHSGFQFNLRQHDRYRPYGFRHRYHGHRDFDGDFFYYSPRYRSYRHFGVRGDVGERHFRLHIPGYFHSEYYYND